MHYEIQSENEKVLATADTWQGIMDVYNACRKASNEHIHLEKIDDEKEKEL